MSEPPPPVSAPPVSAPPVSVPAPPVLKPSVFDSCSWMDTQENEPEVPSELDTLVNQVQETSLDPDCNDLCDKMISSWSHKGVAGEASPKLLLMTPCGEKDHTPVPLNREYKVRVTF